MAQAAHLAFPDEVSGVRAGALSACLDVQLGDVEAGVATATRLPDRGGQPLTDVAAALLDLHADGWLRQACVPSPPGTGLSESRDHLACGPHGSH